jgi:hypothetical protein
MSASDELGLTAENFADQVINCVYLAILHIELDELELLDVEKKGVSRRWIYCVMVFHILQDKAGLVVGK